MKCSPTLVPAVLLGLTTLPATAAEPIATLPGTAPLAWSEADLSGRLMDGAHAFVERQIGEAAAQRASRWAYDFTSPEAYERSVAPNRENLFLPDRLWAAKPREGVSMRFLAFFLGSEKGRAALSKLAEGSSGSMKNITKREVLAFSGMAPPLAEQERIASCLSSLDNRIASETQKLEALKTRKKGLMQQLFPSPEEALDS